MNIKLNNKNILKGNNFLFRIFMSVIFFIFLTMKINGEEDVTTEIFNNSFSRTIRNSSPILLPKCDSPRQTIESFYSITKKIKNVFEHSSETRDIDWRQQRELTTLYSELKTLIDHTELSQKEAFAKINVVSSQLSEVLDRIQLPPLNDIPDASIVKKYNLDQWRIPHTEIALIRISKGLRQGDWIFSAETIAKTSSMFHRSKKKPFLKDANIGLIKNNGGILENYLAYTGSLIPKNFTQILPSWMLDNIFHTPLWKYFATAFTILLIFCLGFIILKLTRYRSDKQLKFNNISLRIRYVILPLSLTLIIPFAIDFITINLRIRLIVLDVIDDTLWMICYFMAFWLSINIGNLVSVLITRSPAFPHASIDKSLIQIICRILACVCGFWIILDGLSQLGVSMVPLIAGASVGGLAFALAVKPTLSNIISGMLIYADKPFSIGHRISIKNYIGDVEMIGLRSTRIRTLDGYLVSIPNDEVCNTDLGNISKRPAIKRQFSVTITYDTSPKKIKKAMDIIRQLLSIDEDKGKTEEELGHPPNSCLHKDPKNLPRVFFDELNADSLNILVIYYFSPAEHYKSLEYATWFNSELIERFNKAKIKFAFPTQTIEYKPV